MLVINKKYCYYPLVIIYPLITNYAHAIENLSFNGSIIEDTPCIINDSLSKEIEFGQVSIKELNDNKIYKTFQIATICRSSFDKSFKVRYTGQPSKFDVESLATSIDNLAIGINVVSNGGEIKLKLGDSYNSTPNKVENFIAYLHKNPTSNIEIGRFEATASFSIEYN